MATPTHVDKSAPVLAHHEVEIQAPVDAVWQLHVKRQQLAELAGGHNLECAHDGLQCR